MVVSSKSDKGGKLHEYFTNFIETAVHVNRFHLRTIDNKNVFTSSSKAV